MFPKGKYEPSNCKWSSSKVQARNTSRTRLITWSGKTQCMNDWAVELGITGKALAYRLKHWGLDKAMTFKP
jgi:hypothetical protein